MVKAKKEWGKKMALRLTPEHADYFSAMAKERGITMAETIRRALDFVKAFQINEKNKNDKKNLVEEVLHDFTFGADFKTAEAQRNAIDTIKLSKLLLQKQKKENLYVDAAIKNIQTVDDESHTSKFNQSKDIVLAYKTQRKDMTSGWKESKVETDGDAVLKEMGLPSPKENTLPQTPEDLYNDFSHLYPSEEIGKKIEEHKQKTEESEIVCTCDKCHKTTMTEEDIKEAVKLIKSLPNGVRSALTCINEVLA